MRIDKDKARTILEEEVVLAQTDPVRSDWVERTERISKATEAKGKTIVAMLGTAMLAKATDIKVDPFALKAGLSTPGAYSARSLCQHVLAAHAPRLEIDLGVTGREPLNNQPFFGQDRVHAGLPVHKRSRAAFDLLLEALGLLAKIKTQEEARLALRAFLQVRRLEKRTFEVNDVGWHITPSAFVEHIRTFVTEDSESGKRAQAVATGLMDSKVGYKRVWTSKIHDPDRHFPGDVGILDEFDEHHLMQSIEVRDKPVALTDIYHFITKAAANGVCKAALLAVSDKQGPLMSDEAIKWAEEREVVLVVYTSWKRLVMEILLWSTQENPETLQKMYERIHKRTDELEVSSRGIKRWLNIMPSEV